MNAVEKITGEPRLIYLICFIIIMISTYVTITVPLVVEPNVTDTALEIDKLQEGSKVYFVGELTSALVGDTIDAQIVIFKALLSKGCHILVWATNAEADVFNIQTLEAAMGAPYEESPLYGTQVVDLGFVPGLGVTVKQHTSDIRSLNPRDRFGNLLDDLPATQNFNKAEDMDLVYGSGSYPVHAFAALLSVPYDLPSILLYHSGGAAMVSTYYATGQYAGYVAGVLQGAQLELELSRVANMPIAGDAIKYAFVVVGVNGFTVIGIVAANIYGAIARRKISVRRGFDSVRGGS